MAGEWDVFWNAASHIVLPAAILGYFSLAYISRMTRSFMLEQLSQEYITTARVKGVKEWRVIWVQALGKVWVPLVTVIARSEEHTSELQSIMRSSYAVFCLTKKNKIN